MLSGRMNKHAARALRWLADGGEFEGESLLQAAWEWREFATDMRQMELLACAREELFDPPAAAGDAPVARTDTLSARLARGARQMHEDWEIDGKMPRHEAMEWIIALLDLAGEVNDFETSRHPRAPVTPDIQPQTAGNVVRLTRPGNPTKTGGRK